MVDRINDIAWQAHQGSVAAIIQLLNENLAHLGVRTRAVFSNGVLQLLCEAQTVEQLEQSNLIQHIQQVLESIAPRNINRISINSRIVREQQLLWLEEISRDAENQLLWSEEIELDKPNILRKIVQDFQERQQEDSQAYQHVVLAHNNQTKKIGWGWVKTGLSLCLFLLLGGWTTYYLLGNKFKNPLSGETSKYFTTTIKSLEKNINQTRIQDYSRQNSFNSEEDPFAAAVRIANITSDKGKIAKTDTQWLELAANWQRASYLMSLVSPNHSRYQEAQIRIKLYKKYSEAAQKEANKTSDS
ncbi:hypothetical protein [Calothrix rhizosoleniae]|uniref:hypothetical protein n=1 Tax=Calothrix rhizosoleniae TaxID=888997 RepID=UPI000B4A432D|nr:hypothetical protein [Calothrix rhizosoleniae]